MSLFTLNFNAPATITNPLSGCSWTVVSSTSNTQWTTGNTTTSLIGFNGQSWSGNLTSVVNIPSTTVRSIGNNAFLSCTSLSSILIPTRVTTIGTSAFKSCTSLSSITFDSPSTVRSIGDDAFQSCGSLSSITIPNSVTSIGTSAFQSCTFLSSITFDSPSTVTRIDNSAFQSCTLLSSIVIPPTVTSIGTSAFRQCSSLSSITIPSSVTSIGTTAFRECNSLSSVTFDSPSSVSSIGDDAFYGCSSLSSITIPTSVTSIGFNAFYSCTSLSSITIPSSVTSIGTSAFDSCTSLSALYIPSSVTSIDNNAFFNIANPATLYTSPTDSTNPVIVYFQSDITSGAIVVEKYPADPPQPLVCFNAGSKILTDKGYVPIETLRKGDNVKTLMNGYVAIDMIGYREIENVICKERIKDKLYVCKESEYPELFEDLVITGSHAILVDEFKEGEREKTIELLEKICITDNKYRLPACVDSRASAYEKEGKFTIYHLALENDDYYTNYGIYANGLLVETCSKRYLKELSNMTLL